MIELVPVVGLAYSIRRRYTYSASVTNMIAREF